MKPTMTPLGAAFLRNSTIARAVIAAGLGLCTFVVDAAASPAENRGPGPVVGQKTPQPPDLGWRKVPGGRVRALRTAEATRLRRVSSSFVIEAPTAVAAMAAGAPKVKLYVPTTGRQGVTLDLALAQVVTPDVQFITRSGVGGVASVGSSEDLVFYVYMSSDAQMRRASAHGVARAVVQAGNPLSLSVNGIAGTKSLRRFSGSAIAANELSPGTSSGLVVETGPLSPSVGDAALDCQSGDTEACQNYCWQANAHGTCDPEFETSSCCEPYDDGGPSIHHECNSPEDDDGDGLVNTGDPDCQHTEYCDPDLPGIPDHLHTYEGGVDVALLGDIVFCTKYRNDWITRLWGRAGSIRNVFRQPSGNAVYDEWLIERRAKPVRIAAIGCWVIDDLEDAEDCRSDGGAACAPFQAGATHEYPYAGFGDSQTAYAEHALLDVWHGTTQAGLSRPVSAAHVVVDVAAFDDPYVAGVAEDNHGFGSTSRWNAGYKTSAHEIGHTLDLNHCLKTVLWTEGDGSKHWSIMASQETGDCGSDDLAPGDVEEGQLGTLEGGALFTSMVLDRTIFPASFGNHGPDELYE
jgi:hypothetical protein